MRRIAVFLGVVALLGAVVAAPVAAAGPDRYQTKSATWTISVDYENATYAHVFDIDFDPCAMTFEGTGGYDIGGTNEIAQTIEGSFDPRVGTVTWKASAVTFEYPTGILFEWWITGDATGFVHGLPTGFTSGDGSDTASRIFTGVVGVESLADVSTWKNHGAYVSAMGGGADAAHSCIGMPVQAQS